MVVRRVAGAAWIIALSVKEKPATAANSFIYHVSGGCGAMNCPQCGSMLADAVTLCPECGAPVVNSRSDQAAQPLEDEIHALLTEANLLRMRRQHDLATAKCVAVLRRYPNNASAHSLLGDISRDQGAYADAIGWYQLAIQLDPTSVTDRHKIGQLERQIAATAQPAAAQAPAWRALLDRARARPPIGLLLGLVLGLILVGALVALRRERDATQASMLQGTRMPRVVAPRGETQTPSGSTASSSQLPRPRTATDTPPAVPQEPVIYAAGRQPPPPPPSPAANPADKERALLESLRAGVQAEGLMAAVDSVIIDPRDISASVAIMVEDAVASPDSRGTILQTSLRVAELAMASDESLSSVTVRCSAPVPGADGVQREQVVFVGDVSSAALRQAAGKSLTMDEALALFASPPWWHVRMRRPA